MKIHNSKFRMSILTLFLLINFTFIACEENKVLTEEDSAKNNEGINLVKADLSELIGKIEGKNANLVALLKDNPASKLKESNLQKGETFEFLFDTDHIMALRINSDHLIYMIPAYKSNNQRDNNLYSVSINIDGNTIETKLTTTEINSDGTQTSNTRTFNFSSLTSKNQTYATYVDMEIKCDCVAIISDCTCHTSHASGGCDHPDVSISCTNCSGGSGISITNPATSTNNNTSTSNNQIIAISSSGSNYGYTYNLSGNGVYLGLMKKYQPDYVFSALQKYNIINTPEISNPLLQFLDIDGSSKMNKDFALTIINAIEEGTVTTYQEFNVLMNVYKKAKVALLIEEQIDDTLLDPCPKEVMDQLKKTKNADVANVLAKLGANTLYTVNIVMKPAATYAETQKISKYNYEIRVDRDRSTDGTKLYKAAALIHELIHAYFLSIIDDYNYTPSTSLMSFPELFEVYVKKEHPTSTDRRDAQHLAMANRYVDAIASALQEYDANSIVPYQVYKDLAWGGLKDAPIFDATFPPGSADNIRIKNRHLTEALGRAVDQGTPNEQSPLGKTCN